MYRASALLAGIGVVLLLIVALLGGTVIRLYGDLPPGALQVLLLLGAGLVAVYGTVPSNYMFTAIRQQRDGMVFAFINLAVLAAQLLLFVPEYGAWGAALAVIITQYAMWIVALAWLDLRHLRTFRLGELTEPAPGA
jgi:O-antigen/teichoic acid export membrane protein